MEGYIHVLKYRKFTKLWGVLEGQQFSYYQDLDREQQEPVGIQGVLFVQNAEIQKTSYYERKHVISIRCEGKKSSEYIDLGSVQLQTEWFKALIKASKWHEEERRRSAAPLQYRSILGIAPDVKLTQKVITRTYRKLSLKAHPDKGGDVSLFNDIHQAYTHLMALQVEEDEKASCDEIEYEALIQKAEGGVGLGIVVLEDPLSRRITVKSVQKGIILRGLSVEASGEIRPGDVLVAIEKDDCSRWPLSRVRARLNSFRVPVGSVVRVTLLRRVHRPADEENDPAISVSSPPMSPISETDTFNSKNDVVTPPPPPAPESNGLKSFKNRNGSMSSQRESWSDDSEPVDAEEQGNLTPKATPRPKQRLSVSPTPSPAMSPTFPAGTNTPPTNTPSTARLGVSGSWTAASGKDRDKKSSDLERDKVVVEIPWECFDFEDIDVLLSRLDFGANEGEDGAEAKEARVNGTVPISTLKSTLRMYELIIFVSELESIKCELRAKVACEQRLAERVISQQGEIERLNSDLRVARADKVDLATRAEDMEQEMVELRERGIALAALLEGAQHRNQSSKLTERPSDEVESNSGNSALDNLQQLLQDLNDLTSTKRNHRHALNSLAVSRFVLKELEGRDIPETPKENQTATDVPSYMKNFAATYTEVDNMLARVREELSTLSE